MNCKRGAWLLAAALLVALFGGCAENGGKSEISVPTVEALDTADMFTQRDTTVPTATDAVTVMLKDDASTASAAGVKISKNTVTVTAAGTYRLSGTLTDGQITVEAPKADKVSLILDGVSVTGKSSAALYVKQADKVFVTLADGTENTLSVSGEFAAIDSNNIDGAVFSKEDLTFNGNGKLTVSSACGHGIVCKDSLVFASGTYAVTAAAHAIQGKDDVRIADGSYTLTAEKDGIHVENADDASCGYLYIRGGSFHVTAQGDGFSASNVVQIEGGEGTLTTGGGAASSVSADSRDWFWNRGPAAQESADSASAKGMKAETNLLLHGGTWTVDAADDALHSNASVSVKSTDLTLKSGDDGIHADTALVIESGNITVTQSYEGLEGTTVEISGGTIDVTATDDGINAAGGADQSGMGGRMPRPDGFSKSGQSDTYIRISGGRVTVNAAGDGVDSNGVIYVTGGETYVSGPTDGGNAALDYESGAQITGGIFVAAGSTGMAENFTSADGQGAMLVSTNGAAGDILTLTDDSGKTLLSWTPPKTYACAVISCPGLQKNATYTLTVGSDSRSVSMNDWLYSEIGGMGNQGGRNDRGGMPGNPGDPGDPGNPGGERRDPGNMGRGPGGRI